MGATKPLVIVTRRLPERIETRMRELFATELNIEDRPDELGPSSSMPSRVPMYWCPTVTDPY